LVWFVGKPPPNESGQFEHVRLTSSIKPSARLLRGGVPINVTVLAPAIRLTVVENWVQVGAVKFALLKTVWPPTEAVMPTGSRGGGVMR
jgi:hypothetical protein